MKALNFHLKKFNDHLRGCDCENTVAEQLMAVVRRRNITAASSPHTGQPISAPMMYPRVLPPE